MMSRTSLKRWREIASVGELKGFLRPIIFFKEERETQKTEEQDQKVMGCLREEELKP